MITIWTKLAHAEYAQHPTGVAPAVAGRYGNRFRARRLHQATGSLGVFMDVAFSEHHPSDGASIWVSGTGKRLEYPLRVCR